MLASFPLFFLPSWGAHTWAGPCCSGEWGGREEQRVCLQEIRCCIGRQQLLLLGHLRKHSSLWACRACSSSLPAGQINSAWERVEYLGCWTAVKETPYPSLSPWIPGLFDALSWHTHCNFVSWPQSVKKGGTSRRYVSCVETETTLGRT